jgi:uncharacterized RDD family membrane protein YckC
MRWLWFIGPLMVVATYLAVILAGTTEDVRRKLTLNRWLDELLGPLLGKDGKPLNRRVRALPDPLAPIVEASGGGARVADVVLVPQHAYLAVRAADGETVSTQHTVVCRLEKTAPTLVVRPLPILDGRPVENHGLAIEDAFGEEFIVEGESAKAAKKWLDEEVRSALLELPEAWLRTDGNVMALTLYGALDVDRLDALVGAADALYARHGATDATLFGEDARGETGDVPTSRIRSTRKAATASDVADGELATPDLRLRAGAIDLALYGIAAFLVAVTNGSFASFHPVALFNNPDVVITQPWQGGFTTKGIGAFTAALLLLVGLFAYQTFQAANHGRSIGKWLVGLRIVRDDDGPIDFARAVLLRSWVPAATVFGLAAILTKPFSTGAMFARVLTYGPSALAAGLVALGVATLSRDRDFRGFHDKLAGTKVVEAERAHLVGLQLAATRGMDPALFGQVLRAIGGGALFLAVHVALNVLDVSIREVPQEALAFLVMLPLTLLLVVRRSLERA